MCAPEEKRGVAPRVAPDCQSLCLKQGDALEASGRNAGVAVQLRTRVGEPRGGV